MMAKSAQKSSVPRHVAIVMDGNGRWANARGLPRTEGHRAGEKVLMEVIQGALEAGVEVLSVYAFSTENWRRSPREVAFLMGYSRDVIHARAAQLNEWGVRMVWSGREALLWRSVLRELRAAEKLTANNSAMIFNMCVNYGGRAEIADAVAKLAQEVAAGKLKPEHVTPDLLGSYMYQPKLPDVDLFIRTGGEQRTSNFLLWESPYAELMFVESLWPDFGREELFACLDDFSRRDRRFGGAKDAVVDSPGETA